MIILEIVDLLLLKFLINSIEVVDFLSESRKDLKEILC